MGGGIERDRLELLAGADGLVAPLTVVFPPALAMHDGSSGSANIIILALETSVGTPAPSGPFRCELRDANGWDRLWGAGQSRNPSGRQRTIIQGQSGRHPVVSPGESLTFVIEGNMTPNAVVYVSLYYADARPQDLQPTDEQVN